jgi:mRNA interferase RelE/StbE
MGYRLVYSVDEDQVFVTVIAVGKRDKQQVCDAARSRP